MNTKKFLTVQLKNTHFRLQLLYEYKNVSKQPKYEKLIKPKTIGLIDAFYYLFHNSTLLEHVSKAVFIDDNEFNIK